MRVPDSVRLCVTAHRSRAGLHVLSWCLVCLSCRKGQTLTWVLLSHLLTALIHTHCGNVDLLYFALLLKLVEGRWCCITLLMALTLSYLLLTVSHLESDQNFLLFLSLSLIHSQILAGTLCAKSHTALWSRTNFASCISGLFCFSGLLLLKPPLRQCRVFFSSGWEKQACEQPCFLPLVFCQSVQQESCVFSAQPFLSITTHTFRCWMQCTCYSETWFSLTYFPLWLKQHIVCS